MVLGVVLMAALAVGPADPEDGFKPLFDGKSLAGWDGDPRFWKFEAGEVVGQTTKANPTQGNTFLVWRQGEVDDFELRFDYKIVGGNSGVQYRSREFSKWVIGGYQADIDSGPTFTGILYEERGRGVMAQRGEAATMSADGKKSVTRFADGAALSAVIKKEDWNSYRIVAQGNKMQHYINGALMSQFTDHDAKAGKRIGLLALQLHAGPPMKVSFKNVRMKRLALAEGKKVVFVAGTPSHAWGDHEHNAGCKLLAQSLAKAGSPVLGAVYRNGWPADPTAFDNADALVFYCDGGGGHYANGHLKQIDALMKKGVGLACLHYGVEVPKGASGDAFLDWIGGYFEAYWSVNPHWDANFTSIPKHPVGNGVKPFKINDEWYYHMRFRPHMTGVTPILEATPPDATRKRDWGGSHGGNAEVLARRGQPEIVAWAAERPDGGRGFGFTGGHVHFNWGDDQFRKLVLNAITWVAKAEVPPQGVVSPAPTRAELETGLDKPRPGAKKASR